MKRLDQIEARRVLTDLPGDDESVIVVTEPGQYYLTRDLTAQPQKVGLKITAPNVSIDLNGFTLVGVPNSLDAVRVLVSGGTSGGGGSFFLTGHQVTSPRDSSSGLATGRVSLTGWGGSGVSIDGPSEVSITCLSVESCGNGIRCLRAEHIVHRDIACRACAGDGVYIEGATSSPLARGPRQTVSLDGVFVSDCAGDCVRIISPTSGACDVRCSNLTGQDCAGSGLKIKNMGVVKGNINVGNANFTSLGGTGVSLDGGNGGAGVAGSHWEARVSGVVVDTCALGGLRDDDCDGVEYDRVSALDCTGDGISSRRAGKAKYKNIVLRRCTGDGVHVQDAQDVDCYDTSASDCGGDGVSALRVRRVRCEFYVESRCQGNGLHFEDCDDSLCKDCSIAGCASDGVRYTWAIAQAPQGSTSHRLTHSSVHVSDCGGAGVSMTCPSGACVCTAGFTECSSSNNAGPGLSVTCPSSENRMRLTSSQPVIVENQKGLSVRVHPAAEVSLSITGGDISRNLGDGLSVVSLNPALSLRGGGGVHCTGVTLSRNGGSGCVCECPLTIDSCTCSENAAFGVSCTAPDAFTLACSMQRCVLQRNGAACARCGPGRFAGGGSQFSDGLAEGVRCDGGCCLLTDCDITHCALDGVSAHGTLTVQGGTSRRNGGWGYSCSDGTCVARACNAELNGGSSNGVAVGGGMLFTDCSAVTVEHCVASSNLGDGFRCTSSVGPLKWMAPECISSRNSGDGFHLADCEASYLDRCVASGNGGLGFRATGTFSDGEIRDCVATGNAGGIQVAGHGNLITRCSATTGTLGGIQIAPSNSTGATIDGAALPQRCNPSDNVLH